MIWARLRQWSRLFSEYAAAQAIIQLLGVLAGLLLVNLLPVREYALYTLALSILTFLSMFSDLGVSSALLYFRREARAANAAFEPYVRAAYRIRYALLAAGGSAGLAFMALKGQDQGFRVSEIGAVGIALVLAVWIQVGMTIGLLLLRMEGLYRESYVAEACGNAARLLCVGAMWLMSAPLAWLAMLSGAAGSLVTAFLARGRSAGTAQSTPGAAPVSGAAPARGIIKFVMPTALSAAYFSIQAPLIVWISAYFAGTASVAEVGALGRLAVIFSLVSGFMGAVLIPRFSAVTDEALYLRRYLQCWAALVPFGIAVIAIAWGKPGWLLLLLGDAYKDLEVGVLLVAVSTVLGSWSGFAVGINNSRGWVRHTPLVVGTYALVQITLIAVLDLSTTIGVLYFGLWSSVAGLLLQIVISTLGFTRPRWIALARK